MKKPHLIVVLLLGLTTATGVLRGAEPASPRSQQDASAAFPGKQTQWNGFTRFDFQVDGKPVLVVAPHKAAPGRPWVWHGEFFGHKPAPDIALLKQGFHIAYMQVPDMLGSPTAVEHWNKFYAELTGKYGLARKPALVGLSRGGLYCYNWAAANPDQVACIYGDAPVCDFKSWPGGKGKGKGSSRDWQLVLQQYGFKSEAEALAYDKNPIDNLEPLAKANVPLLHVYGDADDVVPWNENTGIIAERYRKLGGEIILIGKKGVGHHPHGLDDSTPIVEFIAKHASVVKTSAMPVGRYYTVDYEPSSEPGKLQLGVTYTLWVPDGMERLRGVIVHQHGCGTGACQGGATAAYDLHWQALARKWNCALLGPSYHQDDKQNCRLWCDPRNGSEQTFLHSLQDFAEASDHPELTTVPWCLWGHSGGAFWASLMQVKHPERIVAIWFRSGTAYASWEKGEIPAPTIPESAYQVPAMCNPGAKENGDARFRGAWDGSLAMFKAYRAKGAPIGFAPDPRTAHECGDSRYLAIPFFDVCLAQRLPDPNSSDGVLKPIDPKQTWLATLLSDTAAPASAFSGKSEKAVWLPNEQVAQAWSEYVKRGVVTDTSPPPAADRVVAKRLSGSSVEVTWNAQADLESGIQGFIIQRDGQDLARLPEKPQGRFGRPLFQAMSYHDTPEKPLPEMRFVDSQAELGKAHEYLVIVVNSEGLKSEPSVSAKIQD
jgi:pimeloyl-ACP methyl ester carboxylesterase